MRGRRVEKGVKENQDKANEKGREVQRGFWAPPGKEKELVAEGCWFNPVPS